MNKTQRILIGIVLFILIVPVVILGSLLISGWLVKKSDRKYQEDYIKNVEQRKSALVDKKMKLINKLNKAPNSPKADDWKRQIENIDMLFKKEVEVSEKPALPPAKETMLDKVFNEAVK